MGRKRLDEHEDQPGEDIENPEDVAHADGLVRARSDSHVDEVPVRAIPHHLENVIRHRLQMSRVRRILDSAEHALA